MDFCQTWYVHSPLKFGEIWFGIPNGQILSIFDRVRYPRHACIFVSGQQLHGFSFDACLAQVSLYFFLYKMLVLRYLCV